MENINSAGSSQNIFEWPDKEVSGTQDPMHLQIWLCIELQRPVGGTKTIPWVKQTGKVLGPLYPV